MIIDVELLNVIKYEKKEDKKPRTMLTYRLLNKDALQTSSEKFKGYACLNAYFDGFEVYEKIKPELCGTAVKLTVEKKPSSYDPMKEISVIKKINDINLV